MRNSPANGDGASAEPWALPLPRIHLVKDDRHMATSAMTVSVSARIWGHWEAAAWAMVLAAAAQAKLRAMLPEVATSADPSAASDRGEEEEEGTAEVASGDRDGDGEGDRDVMVEEAFGGTVLVSMGTAMRMDR